MVVIVYDEDSMADQMRRDAGGKNVALPQGGTHEPDTASSKVAKPTVDEAR